MVEEPTVVEHCRESHRGHPPVVQRVDGGGTSLRPRVRWSEIVGPLYSARRAVALVPRGLDDRTQAQVCGKKSFAAQIHRPVANP